MAKFGFPGVRVRARQRNPFGRMRMKLDRDGFRFQIHSESDLARRPQPAAHGAFDVSLEFG